MKLTFLAHIGLLLLLFGCDSSTGPERSYQYEVIPFSQLPTQAVADSTFYTFSGSSSLLWSPNSSVIDKRLDSIFGSIISRTITLKQAWYQPGSAMCGDLTYAPPPILVVKLAAADSKIQGLSFSVGLSNFHNCPEI